MRRAARCVGAFAAAPPAQHARALSAIGWSQGARARAGPTWESERSSSVARARQGARRKGRARRSMASGEMVGSRSVLRRAWQPAAAGRRRAVQGESGQILGRTHGGRIKGGPSQYPEKAAALAFFRARRITLIMSRDRVTEYRERRAQSRPLAASWRFRTSRPLRAPRPMITRDSVNS